MCFQLLHTMMQSIAIILICIIVKLYDCSTVAVVVAADDRSEWPLRFAASMPSPSPRDVNSVRAANDWLAVPNKRNTIHQHIVNLHAGDDSGKQMHDKSSQPNKHDNDITVMNRAENNVNDSGNRIQQHRIDDDHNKHSDLNGTRTSRIKRQSDRSQDICDTQCVCRNDENFLTVECNFKQVSHLWSRPCYFRISMCALVIVECVLRRRSNKSILLSFSFCYLRYRLSQFCSDR